MALPADRGFQRDPEAIRQAIARGHARLTAATANRDAAVRAAEIADDDIVTYSRHIELCRRALDGLLDEWNARVVDGLEAMVKS